MSKYNRNEAEPFVAGSLIAAEHLMDQAREEAFGPPQISVNDCKFFSGKPLSVSIDRDKDGKADATGKISYTFFGNIDKIEVNGEDGSRQYSIQFDRTLGMVKQAKLDLKTDGSTDATFHPNYAWFSKKVKGLGLDTNYDDKIDQTLTIKRGWLTGNAYRADLDRNNDGKADNYYDLKRNWYSGNLEKLQQRK